MTTLPSLNPYIGPRTFTREDHDRFFGREQEARELLSRVVSQRLVLFYAQSGAGKSSLVNTRLIPQLEKAGFTVLPVGRVGGEASIGIGPVDNIFLFNLMLRLDASNQNPARLAHLPLADFLAGLTSDDGKRWYYDSALMEEAKGREEDQRKSETTPAVEMKPGAMARGQFVAPNYVLIIDQFEEIITTNVDRWTERKDFFSALETAMLADPKLWVVLVLREDYVAALDPYAALMTDKLRARYYMQCMDVDAALAAIQEPAKAYGRPLAPDVAEKLVDDLRRIKVLGQTTAQLGQYVEPVQLQVVCYQLWENLDKQRPLVAGAAGYDYITAADLAAAGDVDTALARFYEETVANVLAAADTPVSERQLRTWFDSQLITPTGTRGLVLQGATETGGLPNTVVQQLQARFLVRSESRAGGAWVELVHDRFVEPIRESNAAWLALHADLLTQSAQAWAAAGKTGRLLYSGHRLREVDNQLRRNPAFYGNLEKEFIQAAEQRERRVRGVVTLLGVVLVLLFAGLAAWGMWNANQAHKNVEIAAAAAAIAQNETARADEEAQRANQEAKDAIFARRQAEIAKSESDRLARIARVNQLAIQSQAVPADAPSLSLLLAVEALSMTTESQEVEVLAARDALLKALEKPIYLTLTGNSDKIVALAFDPRNRWIVTASRDGTLRLWSCRSGKINPEPIVLLRHYTPLSAIVFSPNGSWLAAGSVNGLIWVWEIENSEFHEPIEISDYGSAVSDLESSPTGRWLASSTYTGLVRLWDMSSSSVKPIDLVQYDDAVLSIAFGHTADLFAFLSRDKSIHLWNLKQTPPEESLVLNYFVDSITKVIFSPTDRWLAATSQGDGGLLWNLATKDQQPIAIGSRLVFSPDGNRMATDVGSTILIRDLHSFDLATPPVELIGEGQKIVSLAFHSDGMLLAAAGEDNIVRLWNTNDTSKPPYIYAAPPLADDMVAISPDGVWLAAVGKDNDVYIWSIGDSESNSEPVRLLHDVSHPVRDISLSSDGKQLAASQQNGSVHLWDLQSNISQIKPLVINKQRDAVNALAFSPDNSWLALMGADSTIRLGRIHEGQVDFDAEVLNGMVSTRLSSDFSPNSQWFAAASQCRGPGEIRTDCRILIRDLYNDPLGTSPIELPGHTLQVNVLRFSPNGHYLASASLDNTVRLWNTQTGFSLLWTFYDPTSSALAMAFSPDGKWLATSRSDTGIQVWNLLDFSRTPIILQSVAVGAVTFSSDGRWMAAAGSDFTIQIWRVGEHGFDERAWVLRGHQRPISTLAFSPNSRWLASGSSDTTVRLWNMSSNIPVSQAIVLRGHSGPVTALAFSSDNRWLATVGIDGGLLLWRMQMKDLVNFACARVGRNLTESEWKQYFPELDYRCTCLAYPPHPSIIASLLDEGRSLVRSGDNTGALANFRKAAQLDPTLNIDPERELQSSTGGRETNKLGFYLMNSDNLDGLWDAINLVQPPVILIHADTVNTKLLQEIRRFRAPNAFVVGRFYIDLASQRQMLESDDPEEQGRALAEQIMAYNFLANLRGENGRLLIDAWMSLNEPLPGPNSDFFQEEPELMRQMLEHYDRFQVAFRQRLQESGVEAVAFNFGPGNFSEPEHYLDYFPRTLAEYVYLGFHEYGWPTLFPQLDSVTNALTYRNVMTGIRAKYGDRHRVIITDFGLSRAYKSLDKSSPDEGWLNTTETLSEDQYWQSLSWYNSAITRDDYVLGASLYAIGHSRGWESFRYLGLDNEGRPLTIINRIAALNNP